MSTLIAEARAFAEKVHAGIYRPNKRRLPYVTHLEEVADLVEKSGGTETEIAAAWLHDTVEDTPTTIEELLARFGDDVAEIVNGLTDLPDFSELLTLQRKLAQAERVRTKSSSVKRVKLGDGTSNVRAIVTDAPLTWNRQKILDYTVGCGVVAHACRDVSALLDRAFYEAYHRALSAHM
jgi:(p)ppGpp synthase/HD superfamily hydrolase